MWHDAENNSDVYFDIPHPLSLPESAYDQPVGDELSLRCSRVYGIVKEFFYN